MVEVEEEVYAPIKVSNPQADMIQTVAQLCLMMCGVGSGKSHAIGIETGDFIKNFPYLILIIAANTHSQLSSSTLKRVFEVWKQIYGWTQYEPKTGVGDYVVGRIPPPHFVRFGEKLKSYDNVISFWNGALIFTASLENYHALDGIEAFGAWLDETKDTREEAVKEVIAARLRQQGMYIDEEGVLHGRDNYDYYTKHAEWQYMTVKGERVLWDTVTNTRVNSYNPLKIYTSPAKVDWLNTWFGIVDMYEEIDKHIFSKTDYFKYETRDVCIVIASTYHNEENLAVDFIPTKLKQYGKNQNLIDMLIFGSPIAKAGGEFVPEFRRLKHVKNVEYVPGFPVHISLDFNTAPYMTGICAQWIPGRFNVDGRGKLRFFRHYCLASPNNKTAEIAKALIKEYGSQMQEGLYFYGDPGGKKRQTLTKEYANDFDAFVKNCRGFIHNTSDRVLPSYPGVLNSKNFLNNLFAGEYDIDIEIDKSMFHLIHDCEYAKEDKNGAMLKERVKDTLTKQTYEKMGHCLDAMRYMVCSLFDDLYHASFTNS